MFGPFGKFNLALTWPKYSNPHVLYCYTVEKHSAAQKIIHKKHIKWIWTIGSNFIPHIFYYYYYFIPKVSASYKRS